MKVLLINTFDTSSGSALAAKRLTYGLRAAGTDASLLVQKKSSQDPHVLGVESTLEEITAKGSRVLNNLPLKLQRRSVAEFSVPWLPQIMPKFTQPFFKATQIKPDLINLHWVNYNYLQIEAIRKFQVPIVWTLHDMWPFTGGCHYSQGCDRFTQACGACPQLNSNVEQDLSSWIWQRKFKAWQPVNLTIVTPSRWLAERAKESSLFQDRRIEVIHNGLDTAVYHPINKQVARQKLNLPLDRPLILFGAINATSAKRKGFHLLQAALSHLCQHHWSDRADVVIFGASSSEELPDLGFRTHCLGRLTDDASLALAYAAADVFVAPSLHENLPNTLVESIACGTPGVAFNIGGISDIIEHQKNGYLAQPYQTDDLARGIAWLLSSEHYQQLCNHARQTAERKFTLEIQAQGYLSLFTEILSGGNHKKMKLSSFPR
jgi:glycosyltransferase involved in cell wall biosynthesis